MLTQQRLKELYSYNPTTGKFTRKKEPGCLDKDGYRIMSIDSKEYKAHRLAWLYIYGEFPDHGLDHINGKKSDNRIKNLRDVKHKINCRNQKNNKKNTSGFVGVCWDKQTGKWRATICINGKTKCLGRYNNKKDAIKTRREANKLNGYHKNHGKN